MVIFRIYKLIFDISCYKVLGVKHWQWNSFSWPFNHKRLYQPLLTVKVHSTDEIHAIFCSHWVWTFTVISTHFFLCYLFISYFFTMTFSNFFLFGNLLEISDNCSIEDLQHYFPLNNWRFTHNLFKQSFNVEL